MNQYELANRVHNQFDSISLVGVFRAIEFAEDKDQVAQLDKVEIKDLAQIVDRTSGISSDPQEQEGVDLYPFDTILHSDETLQQVTNSVLDLREVLFSSIAPPFSSYEEALTWLRKQKEDQPISPPNRPDSLFFYDPDQNNYSTFSTGDNDDLRGFLDVLRELVEKTGLRLSALVMHCLTPLKPILPRWNIEKIPGNDGHDRFQIEINARNLTMDDFTHIHNILKDKKGVEGRSSKMCNEKDYLVFRAMKKHIDLQEEGMETFWTQVLEECEDKTDWTSISTVRMRWYALRKKLPELKFPSKYMSNHSFS